MADTIVGSSAVSPKSLLFESWRIRHPTVGMDNEFIATGTTVDNRVSLPDSTIVIAVGSQFANIAAQWEKVSGEQWEPNFEGIKVTLGQTGTVIDRVSAARGDIAKVDTVLFSTVAIKVANIEATVGK